MFICFRRFENAVSGINPILTAKRFGENKKLSYGKE